MRRRSDFVLFLGRSGRVERLRGVRLDIIPRYPLGAFTKAPEPNSPSKGDRKKQRDRYDDGDYDDADCFKDYHSTTPGPWPCF